MTCHQAQRPHLEVVGQLVCCQVSAHHGCEGQQLPLSHNSHLLQKLQDKDVAAPENVGLWAQELTQQAPHASFSGFLIRAAVQEAQHAAADAWHIQRTTMSTNLSNTSTATPNKIGLRTMRAMKAARSR